MFCSSEDGQGLGDELLWHKSGVLQALRAADEGATSAAPAAVPFWGSSSPVQADGTALELVVSCGMKMDGCSGSSS